MDRPVPRNESNIQLLSGYTASQIFGPRRILPDPSVLQISKQHLETHGFTGSKIVVADQPEISLHLPPLQGPNIRDHFENIAEEQAAPYRLLADQLASAILPPKPDHWITSSGWTRYNEDGSFESIDLPTDEALVFDVETMYKVSPYPIMAIAVSSKAWYSWMSPWLLEESDTPEHLIPFGPSRTTPRIIVGHNVGFDRARIKEEYDMSMDDSKLFFLDTMSLHVASNGLSSPQRPAWLAHRKNKLAKESKEAQEGVSPDSEDGHAAPDNSSSAVPLAPPAKLWQDVSSMNSLAEVAKLHCGIEVDKSTRDEFATPDRSDIQASLHELVSYCANDVLVTHAVFARVWPLFKTSCPSAVTLSGILEMSKTFLPVDQDWNTFIDSAETTYNRMKDNVTNILHSLAEETRLLMFKKDKHGEPVYKSDPWLSQLDWTPKRARRGSLFDTEHVPFSLPAYPKRKKVVTHASPTLDLAPTSWPLLFQARWRGYPVQFSPEHGYYFCTFQPEDPAKPASVSASRKQPRLASLENKRFPGRCYSITRSSVNLPLDDTSGDRVFDLLDPTFLAHATKAGLLDLGLYADKPKTTSTEEYACTLVQKYQQLHPSQLDDNVWLSSCAGAIIGSEIVDAGHKSQQEREPEKPGPELDEETKNATVWPKWYWDIDRRPAKVEQLGPGLDLTVRTRIAPLLFRLTWFGYPIYYSREHGWLFRAPLDANLNAFGIDSQSYHPLDFDSPVDRHLREDTNYQYIKLPHHDGGDSNVGNPLSKGFVAAFEDGRLSSEQAGAAEALELNAKCSYWLSARERVMKQMVVWQSPDRSLGLVKDTSSTQGMILPQVITMGTVTRRAVENTWLTASNAKKNRVGSELKALVKAPKGHAFVGADVDSEELWICSVMGDSYFGFHGATALGWMTLEGTKSQGTDMHSVTARILGITRDGAKVFNYSRIYGAGVKHAVELLRKSNPTLTLSAATNVAKELYASTKGEKVHSLSPRINPFGRKYWHGGTESYVFNMLEQIAMSEDPRTPALQCGVTQALRKKLLPAMDKSKAGEGYLPSRINWVVQSSGVDYLHLLIVASRYLMQKYDIKARYMISVHDEIRYLVKEEDKHRAALALQIANLWTRCMFAYSLGMLDLPQSCAFFSAVDVDHVLRKEVTMDCVTPSSPHPIAPGEALDIQQVLEKTNGSLYKDGRSMASEATMVADAPSVQQIRSRRVANLRFLQAVATKDAETLRKMVAEWRKSL